MPGTASFLQGHITDAGRQVSASSCLPGRHSPSSGHVPQLSSESAVAGCGRRASQPPAPVQKGLLSAPVSGWLGVEGAFLLLQ